MSTEESKKSTESSQKSGNQSRCKRCHRVLKKEESIRIGYGSFCLKKMMAMNGMQLDIKEIVEKLKNGEQVFKIIEDPLKFVPTIMKP